MTSGWRSCTLPRSWSVPSVKLRRDEVTIKHHEDGSGWDGLAGNAQERREERQAQSDWERGYAKGYERALQQLVELVGGRSDSYATDDLVRSLAEKLRREVLHDAKVTQDSGS